MARSYSNNTGVKITKQNMLQVQENLRLLANIEVLVGFPEDSTERDPEPGEKEPITNASLGYIHDNGAPEANIPARPFMRPGIEENQEKIERALSGALKQGMRGNATAMEQALIAAGLTAKLGIQNKINEGIPPPLADATLKNRARRGKGSSIAMAAKIELERRRQMEKLGEDPFFDLETALTTAKPLIETGQMRNAVNYVIRNKSQRRK